MIYLDKFINIYANINLFIYINKENKKSRLQN